MATRLEGIVTTTDRLGMEMLSVFGLPPLEYVALVADLGLHHMSTMLFPLPGGPCDHPDWSLRDDAALRRDVVAAMRDRDVAFSLGEGIVVHPDADVRDGAADLDLMLELGVPRINTLTFDPDRNRSFDQFAELAGMVRERGMAMTIEFGPNLVVRDLRTAVAAVEHVGWSDCRLLVDTMHFARSGGVPAELRALDPDLVGYCQLCDVPLTPTTSDYLEEAMWERLVPGQGELPLREVLAAIPADVIVSLEVPLRSQAEAGVGHEERLRPCVDAARSLLA